MGKMIDTVHDNAASGRGIGWNNKMVQEISDEIKALEAAQPAPRPAGRTIRTVVFSDGYTHRMLDGQLQFWHEERRSWDNTGSIVVTDVEAFIDLRDNPYEKEQTLEEVLHQAFTGCPVGCDVYPCVAKAVRAWFAAQEVPRA